MSYCRFSSDDGKSDVYVYHSVQGGYVTHVAGRRSTGKGANEYENINLPHAGAEFTDDGPALVKARLLELRELGYHIPQAAIDRLQREINEKV